MNSCSLQTAVLLLYRPRSKAGMLRAIAVLTAVSHLALKPLDYYVCKFIREAFAYFLLR